MTGHSTQSFREKCEEVKMYDESKLQKYGYKDFLNFFNMDDNELNKSVFKMISLEKTHVDLRQILIAIGLYFNYRKEEKVELAYEMYDTEGNGYILFVEMLRIF
mmetsp:Transcript_31180/g.28366  ORF Transcript_31180/g.28366 Transcript_31180/m.28366 type:complete len:104 (-) Transcript_31180:166-477(-)